MLNGDGSFGSFVDQTQACGVLGFWVVFPVLMLFSHKNHVMLHILRQSQPTHVHAENKGFVSN